jgi:uncharacterized protein (DUF1501 family)
MISLPRLTRRGFIRAGAATVGTLALRPFGLLPALAQSNSNYRALVCVFLFGGNDSNNTVIPMDDASFQAYTSIRGSLALTASELTPAVYSVSNAPYAFHGKLPELASLFASKELAVMANTGSLVQPLTRSQYQGAQTPIPLNLFSHPDQQLQWQTSIAQGNSPTGWAGRAADYLASSEDKFVRLSRLPIRSWKFARGPGSGHPTCRDRARAIAHAERVYRRGCVPSAPECNDIVAYHQQWRGVGASH